MGTERTEAGRQLEPALAPPVQTVVGMSQTEFLALSLGSSPEVWTVNLGDLSSLTEEADRDGRRDVCYYGEPEFCSVHSHPTRYKRECGGTECAWDWRDRKWLREQQSVFRICHSSLKKSEPLRFSWTG